MSSVGSTSPATSWRLSKRDPRLPLLPAHSRTASERARWVCGILRRLMRFVLSVVFWTYLALSSVALFVVALALWLLTLPFDRNGRLLHLFTCAWGAHYLYFNPLWRYRVERLARIDRGRAFVLVSNHQSFGDILAIGGTYLPFKW